jgi:hypothetical protein
MKLYFVSKWDENKKKTWSGTTWSIYTALSKYYQMHDISLPCSKSLLERIWDRLLRRTSNDIGLSEISVGKRLCKTQLKQEIGNKVIFQFAEIVENTPPPYMYTNVCISRFKR